MKKETYPVIRRLHSKLERHEQFTKPKRYTEETDNSENQFRNIFFNPYFISTIIIFVLLLLAKPSFIIDKKTNKIKPINLTGYTILIGCACALFMGIILKV